MTLSAATFMDAAPDAEESVLPVHVNASAKEESGNVDYQPDLVDALDAAGHVEEDLADAHTRLALAIEKLKGEEGMEDKIPDLEALKASVAGAQGNIGSIIAMARGSRNGAASVAYARQLRNVTGLYGLLAGTSLTYTKMHIAEANEEHREDVAEAAAEMAAYTADPALDYPVTAYSLPKDQVYQQAEMQFAVVQERQRSVMDELLDPDKNPVPAVYYRGTYTREQLESAFAPDAAAVNKKMEERVEGMLAQQDVPADTREVLERARRIVEARKRDQQLNYSDDSLALALDRTAQRDPATSHAAGEMSYQAEGAYDVPGADGLAGQKEGNAKAIADLEARAKDKPLGDADQSTLALLQKRRAQIAVLEEAERAKQELKVASAKAEAAVTANLNHLLTQLSKTPDNKELLAAVDAEAKRIQGLKPADGKGKGERADKEKSGEALVSDAGNAIYQGGVRHHNDNGAEAAVHGKNGQNHDKKRKNER